MYPTKRIAWLTENVEQKGEERFVLHIFDPDTKNTSVQKVTTELLDQIPKTLPCKIFEAEFLGFSHKYVALRGIEKGNMFYSMHLPASDETRLADGTLAYEILGYANTDEDARKLCGWTGGFADTVRMADYLKEVDPTISGRDALELAILLERGAQCEPKCPQHKTHQT
jgi:hypothetical protein